jgi:outer membrane protein assembly factor BamA
MLTPHTLQSFTVELEGTNSSGNIGAAGNLIYQHRNLLKGAENLEMSFRGAIETLRDTTYRSFDNMVEFGTEATIDIPKFLLPFRTEQFIKKYNPSTSVSLASNYQRRPDFTRTYVTAGFGYQWRGNRFTSHQVNPVELNLVQIPFMSDEFADFLEGTYLFFAYQPHLITTTNYIFTYNNQNIQKDRNFTYFRTSLESAGNLLYLLYEATGQERVDGQYKLFNNSFSQYIRGDFDIRYYDFLDEANSLVYRFFAGAAYPYANSTAIPFEKQYFSGGSNGIRAWQVRDLGPGSFSQEERRNRYPNQTADIKLEANLEYRFDLFWLLEGALFLDAGNIWAISEEDEREGALFRFNRFYKDIAVGTGIGARFDFSFFIFRLDLGMKLRDPSAASGERWIPGNRKYGREDFTLNLGIGYPF